MNNRKNDKFEMTLPHEAGIALRRMAAEAHLANPSEVTSATEIAKRIIMRELTEKGLLESVAHIPSISGLESLALQEYMDKYPDNVDFF